MKTNREFCLTHSSGEDIYLYRLINDKGTEVLISNYGAIITSFKLKDGHGKMNDIVLGFDTIEGYFSPEYLEHYPWFGAAIGRYGNRIKNSTFTIGDKTYQLNANNGKDHLHGGNIGFDKRIWALKEAKDNVLVLTYKSPDGEEGYPGNLDVTIRYELSAEDKLTYEFDAVTDATTAVNLTHHGYFNLNNGEGTIGGHELIINASDYLQQDDNLVATGILIPVKGTSHDFTKWKRIDADWNPTDGYDQSFVCGQKSNEPWLVAEVRSVESGLKMKLWTTEPVVHFYSGKWIPRVTGKNGIQYKPFSAFCLETQIHPNAVNQPSFPNTILKPGERYYQKTIYELSREERK